MNKAFFTTHALFAAACVAACASTALAAEPKAKISKEG